MLIIDIPFDTTVYKSSNGWFKVFINTQEQYTISTIMSNFDCMHDFMLWISMLLACEWKSLLCSHFVDTDLLQWHHYQSHKPLQRISRWNTTKSLPCLHDRRGWGKDEGDKGWCSSCYSLLLRIRCHMNWPVDSFSCASSPVSVPVLQTGTERL